MERLLRQLHSLNIQLGVEGQQLSIYDPDGGLTGELLEEVKRYKGDLMRLLKSSCQDYVYTPIPASEKKEYYPLSASQERLYFQYAFDEESLAYNVPQAFVLRGELDPGRLKTVFDQLIRRHELLRTAFELIDDSPAQRVVANCPFGIACFRAGEGEEQVVVNRFVQPFVLNEPPLMRVALVERSEREYILLVDMHHIISDGVSMSILIRDFMVLYNGGVLPQLRLHYKDYAVWLQREGLKQSATAQQDFWLNEFRCPPPALTLPADFSRPAVKSFIGNSRTHELGAAETAMLRMTAESEGVTLFMLMISIYALLLSKISGQSELVVGTPTAGRQHADLENIMGVFVNTLALRYRVAGGSFREFLAMVKARTLACLGNQDYPYEQLVKELRLPRDPGRNPLFDVVFSYQNFEEVAVEIPGLSFSAYGVENTIAKFDLLLTVMEESDRILLIWEYSTDIFCGETIGLFVRGFREIASLVLENPGIPLEDIHIYNIHSSKSTSF